MKGSSYARVECQSPHPYPSPTREGSCLTAGEGSAGELPTAGEKGELPTAGEKGELPTAGEKGELPTAGEKGEICGRFSDNHFCHFLHFCGTKNLRDLWSLSDNKYSFNSLNSCSK